MLIIIYLILIIVIVFPIGIYYLINSAVNAKKQGNTALQWFLIWLVAVITLIPMVIALILFL